MKSDDFVEFHENKFDSESELNTSDSSVEEIEEETVEEVVEESEEEFSDQEGSESNEAAETETVTVIAYDYTSYFESIQNANTFQGACLVAILILFGLLMGLRKHD